MTAKMIILHKLMSQLTVRVKLPFRSQIEGEKNLHLAITVALETMWDIFFVQKLFSKLTSFLQN